MEFSTACVGKLEGQSHPSGELGIDSVVTYIMFRTVRPHLPEYEREKCALMLNNMGYNYTLSPMIEVIVDGRKTKP